MRVLFVFLLSCSTSLAEEWKPADYALLGSSLAVLAIDWGQSRYIVKNRASYPAYACVNVSSCAPPDGRRTHYETNPLLGKEPSISDVDKYFAIAMASTVVLANLLPTVGRRYFLGGLLIVETSVVIHNHNVGVRMEF